MTRSVLRSGWDGADRVDGAGGAVAVASAGAVAVQIAAFVLQVDELAPAGVAADAATSMASIIIDIAAHVAQPLTPPPRASCVYCELVLYGWLD
eukprot:COSAG02_NODE_3096_length_7380_cov_36.086910_1_plen_94_part_00